MSTISTEAEARDLARTTIDKAVLGINANEHPNYVREIVGALNGHLHGALAVGDQYTSDRAELAAKGDLIPPAGAARLAGEALTEAERNGKNELNAARQDVATLRRAALLDALPKVDPAREGLGRDELSMLIGTGSPAQIMTNVHRVAEHGSRDAVAALLSPFGRSLLETRGLVGADLDGALTSAKKVVAESAANRPWSTDAEKRSARLFAYTGEIDSAIASASFYLGTTGVKHA